MLTIPSEGSSGTAPFLLIFEIGNVGIEAMESLDGSSEAGACEEFSGDTPALPNELLDSSVILMAWSLHQSGYSLWSGVGRLSFGGGGGPPVEGDMVDLMALVANINFEVVVLNIFNLSRKGSPETEHKTRIAPCECIIERHYHLCRGRADRTRWLSQ